MCFLNALRNPEINRGLLHLEFTVSKDRQVQPQGCRPNAGFLSRLKFPPLRLRVCLQTNRICMGKTDLQSNFQITAWPITACERVSKWNCAPRHSRKTPGYWRGTNCHFKVSSYFSVCTCHMHTLLHLPHSGIPWIFPGFNPNSTITLAVGRFTPDRKKTTIPAQPAATGQNVTRDTDFMLPADWNEKKFLKLFSGKVVTKRRNNVENLRRHTLHCITKSFC